MRLVISKINIIVPIRLLLLGFLLALLTSCGVRTPIIETDLMALFPGFSADQQVNQALESVRSHADRQILFLVKHPDLQKAKAAALQFSRTLGQDPRIRRVRSHLPQDQERLWWDLYSPYAHQLLSDEARLLLKNNQGDVLLQKVLVQIYSPFAGVGTEELQADPMLLTRGFLSNLHRFKPQLELNEGWLVAEDSTGNSYVMLSAELAIAPYALVEATSLADHIETTISTLKDENHNLAIYRQGTLFYAANGINQAEQEISTIGLGSLVGLLCLFIAVFRSLFPLLLSLVSIGAGLLAAILVTTLAFGDIHIFTLLIGASLIGVSVDYSFHYLCDWQLETSQWLPRQALRRILPAITLGLLTSCLAYLALLATPFRGLQQLAIFSSIGLIVSFLTVVLFYPTWIRRAAKRKSLRMAYFERLQSKWHALATNRLFWLGLFIFAITTLPFLKISDDIRQLQAMPKQLVDEGRVVSEITGQSGIQDVLLVQGDDPEQVLRTMEELNDDLRDVILSGALDGYLNIAMFVPSLIQQESDFLLVKQNLYQPFGKVLANQLKINPALVESSELEFKPLTMEQWLRSPVSDSWGSLWLGAIGRKQGALVPLNGVHDHEAVSALVAQHAGVTLISRANDISELFGLYRVRISSLLLISYFVIFVWMLKRYGFAQATKILAAPLMGGMVALSVMAILGKPLNLFGVLGLVLVLGIGIDYTLFMAECLKPPRAMALAISLSCATTLLAFGLLSLSETAAIQGFGLIVLVGIFTAYLLSFVAYRNGTVRDNG